MSYLPSLIAAALALTPFVVGPVRDLIAGYPATAALIYGLLAVVNHLLPAPPSSPLAKP